MDLKYMLGILVAFAWIPVLAGDHCEGTTLVDTYGYALLEESRVVPNITLRSVSVKFCIKRILQLQIWETSPSQTSYTLRWIQNVIPERLDIDLIVNIPTSNTIRLRPDVHRLGLYVPNSSDEQDLPIFAEWGTPSQDRFRTFYSQEAVEFKINREYGFMTDLVNPIAFNITLCGRPDCAGDIVIPTTPTPIPATTFTPLPTRPDTGACVRGRGRTEGRSVMDVRRVLPGGILRGIRIRTCLLQPFLLQVWEELDVTENQYRLVWQKWIIPKSADGSVQVVLFRVQQYLTSRPSYRAGIQLDPFLNLSIPTSSRMGNLHESATIKDLNLCELVKFRPANFSWDLAMEFCVTTDCSPSNEIEKFLPATNEPCSSMMLPQTTMTISQTTMMTSPTTRKETSKLTTMMKSKKVTLLSPTQMMTSLKTEMPSPTTMMTLSKKATMLPPTPMMTSSKTRTPSQKTMMTLSKKVTMLPQTPMVTSLKTQMPSQKPMMTFSPTTDMMSSTMKITSKTQLTSLMMQSTTKMMQQTTIPLPTTTTAMSNTTKSTSTAKMKMTTKHAENKPSTQMGTAMGKGRESILPMIATMTNPISTSTIKSDSSSLPTIQMKTTLMTGATFMSKLPARMSPSTTMSTPSNKVMILPTTMITSSTAKIISPTKMMTSLPNSIMMSTATTMMSKTEGTSLMVPSTKMTQSTKKLMRPTKKIMQKPTTPMPTTTVVIFKATKSKTPKIKPTITSAQPESSIDMITAMQRPTTMRRFRKSTISMNAVMTNSILSTKVPTELGTMATPLTKDTMVAETPFMSKETTQMSTMKSTIKLSTTTKVTKPMTKKTTMVITQMPITTKKATTIQKRTTRATTQKPTTSTITQKPTTGTRKAITTTTRKPTAVKTTTVTRKAVKTTQAQNTIIKRTTPKVAAARGKNGVRGLNTPSSSLCVAIIICMLMCYI